MSSADYLGAYAGGWTSGDAIAIEDVHVRIGSTGALVKTERDVELLVQRE